MTRKKPWNCVNLPMYSISSKRADNCNMHIITDVSQISRQPKRFICNIYKGKQTLLNKDASGEFVLQLLAETQYRLVDLLGKKSVKRVDKINRLQKRNELIVWNDFYV